MANLTPGFGNFYCSKLTILRLNNLRKIYRHNNSKHDHRQHFFTPELIDECQIENFRRNWQIEYQKIFRQKIQPTYKFSALSLEVGTTKTLPNHLSNFSPFLNYDFGSIYRIFMLEVDFLKSKFNFLYQKVLTQCSYIRKILLSGVSIHFFQL